MNTLKSWLPVVVLVLVVLFLIKALDLSYPISIKSTNQSSEFSVIGEGKVDVTPDTASVNVGVSVNNAPTVQEAQRQINEVNNKIVAAMKGLQIQAADIKTADYSIYPNYGPQGNEISGYNGNVNITIKVKNPDLASKVVQTATEAGANQVNGTQFTVEDPDKYRQMARDKAIANAKEQATKLSKDLGIKLGPIVNLVESSDYGSPLPYADRAMNYGGGGGGPAIEPGSQTITSVVTLYYEKK